MNTPIEELNLTTRSYRCLKRDGINTIGELTGKSRYELIKIRNLGALCLSEIEEKLKALGLKLADDEI